MIDAILWIILTIGVAYLLWHVHHDRAIFENFENRNDVASKIIKIYYDNMKRAPTTDELRQHTDEISEKSYDYNELELRLINSEEYQRLIKTQTDTILPETARMLEEQDLVARIKAIYLKVREKTCPEDLYHPLKDLYIYFDYNIYKFVALLRDSKYPELEDVIKRSPNLDKNGLIELYTATFDNSKLNYDAGAFEEMDNALPQGTRIADVLLSKEPIDANKQEKVNAIALMAFLRKTIKDEEAAAEKAAEKAKAGAKAKAEAKAEATQRESKTAFVTSASTRCTSSQRVYLPDESKIVDTDHGVRVLQTLPPVCIPVGKQSDNLAEVVLYSTLQGTPLDEAKNTQVGSIMPKFEYRRYIDIDVPGSTVPPPAPA
jgi:hypothetical protein